MQGCSEATEATIEQGL